MRRQATGKSEALTQPALCANGGRDVVFSDGRVPAGTIMGCHASFWASPFPLLSHLPRQAHHLPELGVFIYPASRMYLLSLERQDGRERE